MGWRDYNAGNFGHENWRFWSCGGKMNKDEEKARQLGMSNLETYVISGSVASVLKPSKKSSVYQKSIWFTLGLSRFIWIRSKNEPDKKL